MKRVLIIALVIFGMIGLTAAVSPDNHFMNKKLWEYTKTYTGRDTSFYSTQTFSWESLDSLYFVIENGNYLDIDVRLEPCGPSKVYNFSAWDASMPTAITRAVSDSLTNVLWSGPIDSLLKVHNAGRAWIRVIQPQDTIAGKGLLTNPKTIGTKIWYMIKDR